MLPSHGKMSCSACFPNGAASTAPHAKWRMVNDPGAWGSQTPRYLVLGFSKGSTQADIYADGRFDDVAFAGMRNRLTEALQAVNVLSCQETVDDKICNPDSEFAFGSLIRCSVARIDDAAAAKRGEPVYSCSGPLISKAFEEIPHVIDQCARRFIFGLPRSVEAVLFLGNGDKYVHQCQQMLRALFSGDFMVINPMAVRADGRLWVYLAHPSGSNGHLSDWLRRSDGPGLKREQARVALSAGKAAAQPPLSAGAAHRPSAPAANHAEALPGADAAPVLSPSLIEASIYAEGENDVYVPYKDRTGGYPMYSKAKMRASGHPIHHAVNKDPTASIQEVVKRVKAGTHHLRMRGRRHGQRNVFAPEKIRFR